jgi:hypothetical protein
LPWERRVFDLEKQSDFQSLVQDPDLFFGLNPDKIAIEVAQSATPQQSRWLMN